MAERRMLAKSIIESDMFSNMPLDAQMLYIRLNLAADDDGFVSNPRAVMRMCGASDDCMRILVSKKFVLSFEVGDDFVFLIKHWRVHNYLRSDRYKASTFKSLLRDVYYDENKAYSLTPGDGHVPCVQDMDTNGIPTVYQMDTQDRIGKDRKGKSKESIGEVSIGKEIPKRKPILLTDEQKKERLLHYCQMLEAYMNRGWPEAGVFKLAQNEGITADELRAAIVDLRIKEA